MWPRPRWATSTRRPPRSNAIATTSSRLGRPRSSAATPSRVASAVASGEPSRPGTVSWATVTRSAKAASPKAWSKCQWVTATATSGRSVTVATDSRIARPCAGLDPVSTSRAPSVPTTRPRLTDSGSATAR